MDFIQNILPISCKDYENTYLVGGAIRDCFIGKKPFDLDIVTRQNIRKLAIKMSKKIGGKIVPMGSYNNKIMRILSPLVTIDIATLKGKNIVEDLLTRDFTINALAYNLSNGKLFDPVGGIKDISQQKIRIVDKSVFQKDPIRLIRAYRFSLNLNFTMTQTTKEEIIRNGALVTKASGERIWMELSKIFIHPESWLIIADMKASGFFLKIFPELIKFCSYDKSLNDYLYTSYSFNQAYKYIESVLIGKKNTDLYKACKNFIGIKKYHLLKYSLLLSYTMIGSRIITDFHVMSKTNRSLNRKIAPTIYDVSKRLKLSLKDQKFAKSVAKSIMHPKILFKVYLNGHLTKKEMFNYFEKNGSTSVATILGALAEVTTNTRVMTPLKLKFIDFMHYLLKQYTGAYCNITTKEPFVTGNDLIKLFNMHPSPKFKLILKKIHKARIHGKISSRKNALNMIKHFLE